MITIRERIAEERLLRIKIKNLGERLRRSRVNYRTGAEQITLAEAKAKNAADVPVLEKRGNDLITQLAGLNARLESEQNFKVRSRTACVPFFRRSASTSNPARPSKHLYRINLPTLDLGPLVLRPNMLQLRQI